MAFANDTRGKLDDAQAQIVRLREQVEALMKDRVSPAVADYAGRAESAYNTACGYQALHFDTEGTNDTASGARGLYHNTKGSYNTASGVVRDQAQAMSGRVKDQPLIAIIIAAAAGWIIGRVMR